MRTQQNLPAPDFVLQGPFIDPAKPFFAVSGDTIDFLPQDNRTAVVIFPAFPTDGVTSFNGPFTTRANANMTMPMNLGMAPNSPTNFAGVTGNLRLSVGIQPPGTVDSDADGVIAAADVCPSVADPGQLDTDGDRVGDACDSCVLIPNPRVSLSPGQSSTGGQIDDDADGFGNECDGDFTGDRVVDEADMSVFLSSVGKPVSAQACGESGRDSCAAFDVFPGAPVIDAQDVEALRSLIGKPVGPAAPGARECLGPACTRR
jgi:hypothetical protein